MTHQFHELLLSELRMVTYQPGNPSDMTDEMLCRAVTLNENIHSLGYALRPGDMMRLAASPSLNSFFDHLKGIVPHVKAKPMYPEFPQQVMNMTEAEFRLHQAIHYFSTYGLEELLGVKVSSGWLPTSNHPERTEKDKRLMACRIIELVVEQDAPAEVLRILLGRRERLTNPELELVLECAPLCTLQQLQGIKVRFKENIELLFPMLMKQQDREAALHSLRIICAHTGDVLENAKKYLFMNRYHLRSSDKKLLVKLLESYPVKNLRLNLMQSLHLRERNLLVLQHLDYNRFSRSEAHREAVRALRNDELPSWRAIGEALLRERSPEALTHFAQRPGYMVRMLNRLLSLEYSAEDIIQALAPRSGVISGHLALKTLQTLMKRSAELEQEHRKAVANCEYRFQFEKRMLLPSHSLEERKISLQVQNRKEEATNTFLRDPSHKIRVEEFRQVKALEKVMNLKQNELHSIKKTLATLDDCRNKRNRMRLYQNAGHAMDINLLYCLLDKDVAQKLRHHATELSAEVSEMRVQVEAMTAAATAETKRRTEITIAEVKCRYAQMIEEINSWEQQERAKLQALINSERAAYPERLSALETHWNEVLQSLEDTYQREKHATQFDMQSAQILHELLRLHFAHVVTPLHGKKVFIDMDEFDLKHSVLETEDRSKDGGYIRSGIAYRIPKQAKYVRFFVYWNDRKRIDIDLHAGGVTLEGQSLHIGWNSDFCRDGVVHSGDITHSNAAEFIDIDLSAPISEIYTNVHLFNSWSFKNVDTCYVGMMAVDKNGQTVRHYNPENCFFTHRLTQGTDNLHYGFIDVQNRYVRFVGQQNESGWSSRPSVETEQMMFSLDEYLDIVFEGQHVQIVENEADADVILSMGKPPLSNGMSLADYNFFLEC